MHAIAMEALASYEAAGRCVLAWAQGSLAQGLTDRSDLDLVLVWPDTVPEARHRTAWHHSNGDFHLDRLTLRGQPIEVLHRTRRDLEELVADVEHARFARAGVIDPVQACAALVAGQLLDGDAPLWRDLRSRLSPAPVATCASLRRRATTSRAFSTQRIERLLHRGDWFGFESAFVEVLDGQVLPAAFAAAGALYPGPKWQEENIGRCAGLAPVRDSLSIALDVRAAPAARAAALQAVYDWLEEGEPGPA